MTDTLIYAEFELLRLAADDQDVAVLEVAGGDGQSERTFDG